MSVEGGKREPKKKARKNRLQPVFKVLALRNRINTNTVVH